MNPPKINPNVHRLLCSKTGAEVPRGDFRRPLGLCPYYPAPGRPLLVRYRLDGVGPALARADSAGRGIWTYESLLPVREPWPGPMYKWSL